MFLLLLLLAFFLFTTDFTRPLTEPKEKFLSRVCWKNRCEHQQLLETFEINFNELTGSGSCWCCCSHNSHPAHFSDEKNKTKQKTLKNEIKNTKTECYLKKKTTGQKFVEILFLQTQFHCKYAFIKTINKIKKKPVCGSQNIYTQLYNIYNELWLWDFFPVCNA